jgi:hypothetical protein
VEAIIDAESLELREDLGHNWKILVYSVYATDRIDDFRQRCSPGVFVSALDAWDVYHSHKKGRCCRSLRLQQQSD